tara:strand:+ start:2704 stop:2868 length:165 start_codon:yes stop_codon:yes gene_type:complete
LAAAVLLLVLQATIDVTIVCVTLEATNGLVVTVEPFVTSDFASAGQVYTVASEL